MFSICKKSMNHNLPDIRIGTGFDAHAFCDGRQLVLGGIIIPGERGLAGHSDADVLLHAIIDALLGASGLGDIGKLFPDTDKSYKGISSLLLLKKVGELIAQQGWQIINIDSVVICERPKISLHVLPMIEVISKALVDCDQSRISIKGKTTEKLGFTGRGEGIAAQAAVLIGRVGSSL